MTDLLLTNVRPMGTEPVAIPVADDAITGTGPDQSTADVSGRRPSTDWPREE